ncbi:ABC transporter permease [Candidatus Woesearchaeota archaeon]|nr:MAG: ABC transporter permease [Candidatus Woesearchaeota archaeon]
MKIQKSLKLAVNILLHSKLRSWLTIIGIVIGVAAIVAIVSIGEGAQVSVNERLGGLGADIVTISPGFQRATGNFRGFGDGEGSATTSQKNLTNKDIQTIKSVNNILFVNGIVSGRADTSYLAETASLSIQGVDPLAWSNMITTGLSSGRYLNSGDTNMIVIGSRVAASTFKQSLVVNRDITIEGKPFKIVGILESSGNGDNIIYMPIDQARDILNKSTDYYDSISFKVADASQVDAVVNETTQRLMISRQLLGKTQDFSITSAQAIQEQIQSVTQTFTIFLGAIAAVSLLVGAVGIANTMFTSVLEKTKEIGIMKAIGAKNRDIMAIFMLNSALVGFAGGVMGILLGIGISTLLPQFLGGIAGLGRGGITTVVPLSLVIEAILISVLLGMLAGAIPAYRASKLKPVDALRYE